MTNIENKSERLIELADLVISAAKIEKSNALVSRAVWLAEDCDKAIQNIQAIKAQVINGTLQPSNGSGLGISRALSEWNVSKEFYNAGLNLEEYYRKEWCA